MLVERADQTVGQGELTGSSSFKHLVELWLEDLDLEGKVAESTRALYERNMEKLVLPVFANYTLREISVRKVDQFLKKLASTKSYSTAKQARTVLSLAFGLAVRYDAIRENPVRDAARLHKPPFQTMSLTLEQVEAIRHATRNWRRGPGVPGPPPDGQLEQIIETMLGTSARIGEGLAIRRCDRRCDGVPGDRADLRHHRVARRQAHLPSAVPKDAEVDARRVGAEIRGRDHSGAACCRRPGRSRTSVVLHARRNSPTTNNIRRRLRAVLSDTGIEGVTQHAFPCTVATVLDRANGPGPCSQAAGTQLVEDHQGALHRAGRGS